MNRLHQDDWAVSVRRVTKPSDMISGRSAETDRQSPHRFFIPMHYEKNYSYPLIVWLHGKGGTEGEISRVMPHISLRNFVGVAPRGCVTDLDTSDLGIDAYTWDQSATSLEQSMDCVMDSIDAAQRRFNIASDRVFLVGNDVGGTMALRLALTSPQHFGGVVSLGGALPTTYQPLSGIEQARSMPIMLAHSRDSVSYDTDAVCSDLRLLHSAGMTVNLRQYPCEQEVTTKMLSDVNHWVMEQFCGPQCTAGKEDDPTRLRLEDHN